MDYDVVANNRFRTTLPPKMKPKLIFTLLEVGLRFRDMSLEWDGMEMLRYNRNLD